MLEETPHILQLQVLGSPTVNEYGDEDDSSVSEEWNCYACCFCHDNNQQKQVSVNGELWTYNYHVVYEGDKIALGTMVRCLDDDGNVIGQGKILKCNRCYSDDFDGRCDLWI